MGFHLGSNGNVKVTLQVKKNKEIQLEVETGHATKPKQLHSNMKYLLVLTYMLAHIMATVAIDLREIFGSTTKLKSFEKKYDSIENAKNSDIKMEEFLKYMNEVIDEYENRGEQVPQTEFLFARWKIQNNFTSYEGSCQYDTHEKTFPKSNTENALVLLERIPGDEDYCKTKCTTAGADCDAFYIDREYHTCSFFYQYDTANIDLWKPFPYDLYIKTTCTAN